MNKSLVVAMVVVALNPFVWPGSANADPFLDDFEDGAINYSLWDIVGGARGWRTTDPIGAGPWSWSVAEVDTSDGYLSANVYGPATGLTYGAEAWIQTDYNYNDGQIHLIDFTWGATVLDSHHNHYMIQVTDGYIPSQGDLHWVERRPPLPPITEADLAGTTDLLLSQYPDGTPRVGRFYPSGLPKSDWSMLIDASASATLYDGPGGTGSILGSGLLDAASPWHVRFMVSDGTSAGFPAGEAQLRLYDFDSAVVPLPGAVVLGSIGMGFAAGCLRRRRRQS